MLKIESGDTILFQGDSITDALRSRTDDTDLGRGYAHMTAAWYSAMHPEKRVKFLNQGLSGNRVRDLRERWESDCMALNPQIVSILIGANDMWRRYDSNDPTTPEEFEEAYRDILTMTQSLPGVRIVLMEPFVLPVPEEKLAWKEDLDPKINVVRRLAREFNAVYIPLDGLFAASCARCSPEHWSPDGIHPSPAGHALISRAWLAAVKG